MASERVVSLVRRATVHTLQQLLYFLVVGRGQRCERQLFAAKDAIGHQNVKMRMQQNRPRKILDEGHRGRARRLDSQLLRAPSLKREEGPDEDAQRS